MKNWFPLSDPLLNDTGFQSLSASERLFLVLIQSEFCLRGPFYKSDLEVAVTLGFNSQDSVRRARRKVGSPTEDDALAYRTGSGIPLRSGFGFAIYSPGRKIGGSSLATKYVDVPAAFPPDGSFFAQIHRFSFESLLHRVRGGKLRRDDVMVWLVLAYGYWRFQRGSERNDFFVPVQQLSRWSGARDVCSSLSRLRNVVRFAQDERLFDLDYRYRDVLIRKWTWWADPADEAQALRLHNEYQDEVFCAVQKAKACDEDDENDR